MSLFSAPLEYVRNSQIWNSVFRHGVPRDRRTRVMAIMSNVFLHLHPVAVRKSGIRLSFTWCMGGLTFFLFLAEVVSGVLLMFYYRPVIEYAYQDIQDLRAHVTLGLLREIHRWGAHAMIIAIWLHMMRVFLTGSYKPPREFNWVVGVLLLVLTMLLSFTGYLLPWDQLAIWAITVGSNMAKATPLVGSGGPFAKIMMFPGTDVPMIHAGSDARFFLLAGTFVGENALLRFYVLHCVFIPLIVTVLIAIHFWRIRKDGGISGPLQDVGMAKELAKSMVVSAVQTALNSFMPELTKRLDAVQRDIHHLESKIDHLDGKIDLLRKEMYEKFEQSRDVVNELSQRIARVEGQLEAFVSTVDRQSRKMDHWIERLVKVEMTQSTRRRRAG